VKASSTRHAELGLLALIRSDYRAARLRPIQLFTGVLTLSPFWLVVLHRISHAIHRAGVPVVPAMVRAIGVVLYGADLSPAARVGPRFRISHGVGIVVGSDVVIGADATLYQNVTLGGRQRAIGDWWTPRLGDDVEIGAGAVVLGPITVGDNVLIGANAVVIESVPSNSVVVGNPARVVKPRRPRPSEE
jgi:serine O-acetyltransferase